uniref:Protein Wnt n=1 Tax=Romanomermis culicivorax TaxID=13658 RepID=A0A915K0P0_ROMCU
MTNSIRKWRRLLDTGLVGDVKRKWIRSVNSAEKSSCAEHFTEGPRSSTQGAMLLAMPSAYQMTLRLDEDYKDQCRKMSYLVARQRELCTLSKNLLMVVSQGAQMGLRECQSQFSGRRWNCSTQFESPEIPLLGGEKSTNFYQNVQHNNSKYSNNNSSAKILTKSRNLAMMGYQSDQPMDDVADVFGRNPADARQPRFCVFLLREFSHQKRLLRFTESISFTDSREKAYVHAISAAGVAFSITRACSRGELPSCSCDKNVHRRTKNKGQWEWGGCSEDLAYGERLSKDFIDSNEMSKSHDPSAKLMNLHNNEAGRRTIRSHMDLMCKCHGVSGSCTMKICWRKMGDFKLIGETLFQKFDGATRVKFNEKRNKLQPAIKGHKRHTKRDLVYLQESPDFCQENHKLGIYGTRNRKCNRTSYGTDGCSILCCGRGFVTKHVEKLYDCNCKFAWCCEVKCQKCREKIEEYYCK